MKIHRNIDVLPDFTKAVITIGTFDGVHLGHSHIFKQMRQEAQHIGGESVVITFHPHPRMVLANHDIKLLNTLEEKLELLGRQPVDHVVVVPFTLEFSEQSAVNYIKDFIIKYFHPQVIITGYDHHFGKDRSGNYLLLEKFAGAYNYVVKEIPEHVMEEAAISSTRIRNSLLTGDIKLANELLGYPYFFEGKVIEGNKIGRTIGYPTANIIVDDANKIIPADGVYAVEVQIEQQPVLLPAIMSIGIRPTITSSGRHIEVHLLDFNRNIYDQSLRIYLKHFLRSEKKFTDLNELKEAIAEDEKIARTMLTSDKFNA